MIKALITKGAQYTLTVKGHAGGEYGKDIVCAAVSALVQNVLVGLESLDVPWEYQTNDGNARIVLFRNWCDDLDKAVFLMETTVGSLREIANAYSNKIEIVERNSDEVV